jgi:hypothetical protein
MEALFQWAKQYGATLHQAAHLHTDRRIVTASSIEANEPLMTLPFDLVITPSLARRALKLSTNIASHEALILYLLDDEHNSAHKPYIEALPKSFPNIPYHWPGAQWDLLRGTNLYGAGQARLRNLRQSHAELCMEVKADLAWDKYLWAHSVLTSRAFSLSLLHEDEQQTEAAVAEEILLPFLDMLDHSPDTAIEWIGDPVTHTVSFRTPKAIAAGSTLINNYGPKSNEELLLGYGFTVENNPYDTVALKLAKTESFTSGVLEEAGVDTSIFYLTVHGASSRPFGCIPWQLVATLRGQFMTSEEASSMMSAGRQDLETMSLNRFPSLETELETFDQLSQMLQHKVTTLSDYQFQDLSTESREELLRTVRTYRDGQLALLTNALNQAQKLMERLEQLYEAGDEQGDSLPWTRSHG